MEFKYFIISFCVCFSFIYTNVGGQFSDNSPPVMWLDRHWIINSNESIGTVAARVSAHDNEHDTLVFGLERKDFGQGVSRPLPFRIDANTGVVYVNESLEGWVGQNFGLSVTVSDGAITAKNEVWVNILNASDPNQKSRKIIRPSIFPQHPNIANYPPPPSLPNIAQYSMPPRPQPPTIHTTPTNNANETEDSEDETSDVTNRSGTSIPPILNIPNDIPVKSQPDLAVTIVPVVSVCVIFIAIAVVAIVFRKKIYFGKKKGTKEDMAKESNGGIVLNEDPSMTMQSWRGPSAFSNRYEPWERESQYQQDQSKTDKWEFPRHRLKIFNILGEGAFGQVWKSEALDIDDKEGISIVAVKTLKENASDKERADLLSELQVMKTLEPHPNVVRLLGCCTEREPIFLIMEYVSGGKLQSYLRNSRAERYYGNTHGKSKMLTSKDLTTFVYHVAKGMEYLSSKGIIHRDLAARNVLVTGADRTCKVADFGFARDVATSHVYERKSEGRLPIRWMAPESLYDNVFTVRSDVWSFGVLMWEVVTLGSTPYPGLSAADVMRKVRDGHRLDKPDHCRRELYNIMYYCWDKEPKQRPSFTECVDLLEKLLLTETDYIELERFPDHCYYNILSLSDEKL